MSSSSDDASQRPNGPDSIKAPARDAKQMELVRLMRLTVEQMDPESAGIEDATLWRFLRARSLNVEKASKFFVQHQKWRRSFVPLGYIPETEILNELKENKIFLQGHDKMGRPVGVLLARRHSSTNRNLEEFKRFVIYGFDKAIARISDRQESFLIIADLQGWSYKNMDVRGYLAILSILQDHYPERLGKLIMVHVPSIFWGAWKIIHPLIDSTTREKIVFVEDKKLLATLLKDIEEDQLPDIYGGKLPLIPVQDYIPCN